MFNSWFVVESKAAAFLLLCGDHSAQIHGLLGAWLLLSQKRLKRLSIEGDGMAWFITQRAFLWAQVVDG